jgi:hypothetical protein
MDKEEATKILQAELEELRSRRYAELLDLIDSPKTYEITAPSGNKYQIEIQAFWDNPREPGGDLRVIASIDDGGFLSALLPLSMDFIVSPGGSGDKNE